MQRPECDTSILVGAYFCNKHYQNTNIMLNLFLGVSVVKYMYWSLINFISDQLINLDLHTSIYK